MTVESALLDFDLMLRQRTSANRSHRLQSTAEMKARQSAKIREIAEALVSEGFVSLDAQSKALGLCRSTTWTLLQGDHKASGLSAITINRMLAVPTLHALVRSNILEYVADKVAGRYGHSERLRRKFITSLSAKLHTRGQQAATSEIIRLHHTQRRAESHVLAARGAWTNRRLAKNKK